MKDWTKLTPLQLEIVEAEMAWLCTKAGSREDNVMYDKWQAKISGLSRKDTDIAAAYCSVLYDLMLAPETT
jgi:hypothetical protein